MKNTDTRRIESVDALRGFAVVAIMLLHFIEHFIYGVYPVNQSPLMYSVNKAVWDALFFIFAGKSYAIFALLFGFTFSIQYNNRVAKGKDFSGRFAWRLLLLFLFGTLNAAFFPGGDVLVLFSVVGLVLIPLRKLSTKTLAWIALFFLIQPVEIFYTIRLQIDPSFTVPVLLNEHYYPYLKEVVGSGNFFRMIWANITTGQLASFFWAIDAGRISQTAGLFIAGLILARKNRYADTPANYNFWIKTMVYAVIASFVLYICKSAATAPKPLITIFSMWYNAAFTALLIALFIILYRSGVFLKQLSGLSFYGRMSLTNYVSQSIIGSLIFFPYALNLAPVIGIACSLLLGLVVMLLQIIFCKYWLKRHRQGPLESIWHQLTWIKSE